MYWRLCGLRGHIIGGIPFVVVVVVVVMVVDGIT
jgi:hypothetical protein